MDTRETSTLRPLKTWSHLAARRRRPTEYETVSTNLLWSTQDPDRPWTMGQAIPMSGWFKRYRNESPLQHADWDGFRDPDQLIYRNYTLIQDGQEAFVDGLLDEHQRNDHDESLPQAWLEVLGSHWAPARYVVHAQQMSSNYLVALAPSSTIVNCFMLQGGDQLRWVSRIAYRTAAAAPWSRSRTAWSRMSPEIPTIPSTVASSAPRRGRHRSSNSITRRESTGR